jgi:hypothetical protein
MNNPFTGAINVKPGVVFHPETWHRPEMWTITFVVKMTSPPSYNPTITSGVEGRHSENSTHYTGWALDWRIRDYPGDVQRWVGEIKKKLGGRFYVLLEGNHIHTHFKGEPQ